MLIDSNEREGRFDDRDDSAVIRQLFMRIVSLTEVIIILGVVITALVFCMVLIHLHAFTKYYKLYPDTANAQLYGAGYELVMFIFYVIYYIKVRKFVVSLKKYAVGNGTGFDFEAAFRIQIRILKISIGMACISIAYSLFVVIRYLL